MQYIHCTVSLISTHVSQKYHTRCYSPKAAMEESFNLNLCNERKVYFCQIPSLRQVSVWVTNDLFKYYDILRKIQKHWGAPMIQLEGESMSSFDIHTEKSHLVLQLGIELIYCVIYLFDLKIYVLIVEIYFCTFVLKVTNHKSFLFFGAILWTTQERQLLCNYK